MTPSAQRALAGFAATWPAGAVTEAARNIARVSLLDTLAVSFAGRHEPVIGRVAAYARGACETPGPRLWLTGEPCTAETAALLNAVAAHALDYDDVTPAWRGHPGTVLWPALCATAPGASLAALLEAFAIGFEAGAQIGARISAHHYPAGWHATATVGAIAAAVACCRVQGHDATRTFHAIGLASAQAAGLQGNFGTMAKPLQAGFAASAAVRAAALAGAGVEAGDVLEGPGGFASLYGGRSMLPVELPAAGGTLAIEHFGIEVKQFPNCYAAHRAVQAALALREELAGRASQVRAIGIEGTPGAHKALIARLPGSVDEARFSAQFGVACALLDGAVRLSTFSEEELRRADVVRLMSLSRVTETADLGQQRAARVTVELEDGQRLQRTVAALPARFGDAEFMRRLRAKVDDCLAQGRLAEHSRALWDDALAPATASPQHWPALERIWRGEQQREGV